MKMEERKGVLTKEQEEILDKLIKNSGIVEALDGVAIKMIDNIAIEKAKAKIPAEYLPTVYEIVDQIFIALAETIKE